VLADHLDHTHGDEVGDQTTNRLLIESATLAAEVGGEIDQGVTKDRDETRRLCHVDIQTFLSSRGCLATIALLVCSCRAVDDQVLADCLDLVN